jgi:hypothetical protein
VAVPVLAAAAVRAADALRAKPNVQISEYEKRGPWARVFCCRYRLARLPRGEA